MHANCALTYAERETWCNYQQTTNHHQRGFIWPVPPVGQKIKNTFVSDLFVSFLFACIFFHRNDVFFCFFFCFILEGFQSNQITVVSPLIRHNRTLAGGERWREKSRESAFCKKKKKFGKKWITLSHYAPVSNIMLPIISRGLLRAKIKAKSNQTELCCVHIHHKLKGKNGPHVFSC